MKQPPALAGSIFAAGVRWRFFLSCLAAILKLGNVPANAGLLGSGVTYFWNAGRYAEMEVAAREQILRDGKQTATYIAPLCLALGKLKSASFRLIRVRVWCVAIMPMKKPFSVR